MRSQKYLPKKSTCILIGVLLLRLQLEPSQDSWYFLIWKSKPSRVCQKFAALAFQILLVLEYLYTLHSSNGNLRQTSTTRRVREMKRNRYGFHISPMTSLNAALIVWVSHTAQHSTGKQQCGRPRKWRTEIWFWLVKVEITIPRITIKAATATG